MVPRRAGELIRTAPATSRTSGRARARAGTPLAEVLAGSDYRGGVFTARAVAVLRPGLITCEHTAVARVAIPGSTRGRAGLRA